MVGRKRVGAIGRAAHLETLARLELWLARQQRPRRVTRHAHLNSMTTKHPERTLQRLDDASLGDEPADASDQRRRSARRRQTHCTKAIALGRSAIVGFFKLAMRISSISPSDASSLCTSSSRWSRTSNGTVPHHRPHCEGMSAQPQVAVRATACSPGR